MGSLGLIPMGQIGVWVVRNLESVIAVDQLFFPILPMLSRLLQIWAEFRENGTKYHLLRFLLLITAKWAWVRVGLKHCEAELVKALFSFKGSHMETYTLATPDTSSWEWERADCNCHYLSSTCMSQIHSGGSSDLPLSSPTSCPMLESLSLLCVP